MPKKENSILIADIDAASLARLTQVLQSAGYLVLQATAGSQALELSREHQPELAILHIDLEDMSGIEVARRLRSESSTAFLFVSCAVDGAIARQAVEEGALGYLIEPLDMDKLLPAIEAALKRVRELQRLREAEFHLNRALEQSRHVSVAIGLVMERHRLDERSAFEILRAHARSERRKLAEVAKEIIVSTETVNRIGSPRP